MPKKPEQHETEWVFDYADKMIEAKDVIGCIFLLYATEAILPHRPEQALMKQKYVLSMSAPSAANSKKLKSLPKALDEKIEEALGKTYSDDYLNLLAMFRKMKEMLKNNQQDQFNDYIMHFLAKHVTNHYALT